MALFFYLFAFLLILSSIGVILSKNSIYSVLWLIFAFCNSAGLLVLLQAGFLAFTLIIVYVGAVAVLFLFVIMMIGTQSTIKPISLNLNKPLSLVITIIFIADISIVILSNFIKGNVVEYNQTHNLSVNTLAEALYTGNNILPFQMAGTILLVAMISCIVLTVRKRPGVKRQSHIEQISRNHTSTVELVKVKVGVGIDVSDH